MHANRKPQNATHICINKSNQSLTSNTLFPACSFVFVFLFFLPRLPPQNLMRLHTEMPKASRRVESTSFSFFFPPLLKCRFGQNSIDKGHSRRQPQLRRQKPKHQHAKTSQELSEGTRQRANKRKEQQLLTVFLRGFSWF